MDWRKLFGCQAGHELTYFAPKSRDKTLTVQPPLEVLEAGIAEWKSSLVGQFLGAAPNLLSLQRAIEKLWNKGAHVQVSLAGNNLYIFSFNSDDARDWVLKNGQWHIFNKPLILQKWEPNLQRLNFELTRLPLWFHLYNVPLDLYSREGLSYIASALGVPLTMDSIIASKTMLEYAKVCIEVGAKENLPETIDVILANGLTTTIYVEVPWYPIRCRKCSTFVHSDKECIIKNNSSLSNPKIWRKKTFLNEKSDKKLESIETFQNSLPESSSSKNGDVSTNKDPRTEPENIPNIQTDQASNQESSKSHPNISNEGIIPESQTFPLGDDVDIDISNQAQEFVLKINETTPTPKRGRGRPLKIKFKYALRGSANRFDILSTFDQNSSVTEIPVKKSRPATVGVAKLIKDLKTKKKEQISKAKWSWNVFTNYESAINGRIWLLWKKDIDLSLYLSTDQSITVKCLFNNIPFIITTIYGSNSGTSRRLLWQHLQDLDSRFGSLPWIMGCDFNTFMHYNESSDSLLLGPYSSSDMIDFKDLIQELSLFDHPFFGPTYTWSNKQKDSYLARKIDRLMINHSWASFFQNSFVEFTSPGPSDHCMALAWINKEAQINRPKPFKFFNFWSKHPNFLE
ncbi:uncharacterized protein LOC120203808 [Hibiscus syriacus]|uniref:uncharacterized protein LOC120203808 n=1 Tax=Hibiscus syriacus TaxID=106335 RepID=UPI001924A4B8|nr:uncharacterized protein LOC120203808 [Hibiscus syriacus]